MLVIFFPQFHWFEHCGHLEIMITCKSQSIEVFCLCLSGLVHYLSVGKEYNIGRRDCEILIPEDMSISRKHAVIKIIHPDGNLVSYIYCSFPIRRWSGFN